MPTTRTLTPCKTGRVKFATSTVPRLPFTDLVETRHHQDKTLANGRHWLLFNLAREMDWSGLCGRLID